MRVVRMTFARKYDDFDWACIHLEDEGTVHETGRITFLQLGVKAYTREDLM